MLPIYNRNQLLENFKGDEDILLELIDNFLEKINELVQSITISVNSQNAINLRLSGHTLKGIISNFYSTKLTEICSELEKRGEKNNFENIETVYGEFISNIEILCIEIQKLKEDLSTSHN